MIFGPLKLATFGKVYVVVPGVDVPLFAPNNSHANCVAEKDNVILEADEKVSFPVVLLYVYLEPYSLYNHLKKHNT